MFLPHINRNIDSYLVLEQTVVSDDLLKDVLPHMTVNCRQRVVQQVHVCVTVHGPRQADPLLLATAQVNALKKDKVVSCIRTE